MKTDKAKRYHIVMGFTKPKLQSDLMRAQEELDRTLAIIKNIMYSLPTYKDWLNPDIEKEAWCILREKGELIE
jgi:hypothetical protein